MTAADRRHTAHAAAWVLLIGGVWTVLAATAPGLIMAGLAVECAGVVVAARLIKGGAR